MALYPAQGTIFSYSLSAPNALFFAAGQAPLWPGAADAHWRRDQRGGRGGGEVQGATTAALPHQAQVQRH